MTRLAPPIMPTQFQINDGDGYRDLRLISEDGTNRLTLELVRNLADALLEMWADAKPLIVHGNERFFSAGADLSEIQALNASEAFAFAKAGQRLMSAIAQFPAPVYAAIRGYCMGGGLDLALACHRRIAAPNAVFGHRGVALGLVTGWGGTQRLPRLVGKSCALAMFVAAEKLHAQQARTIGLIDTIAEDPLTEASRRIQLASIELC
ncbi:MAG TPA: enoyl-CoA hydratase/isomerase family protein [Terriglobales bacterium]|nr:enoyl-CoA hydratase/isomerase family protein [Terriglobales bacterium]